MCPPYTVVDTRDTAVNATINLPAFVDLIFLMEKPIKRYTNKCKTWKVAVSAAGGKKQGKVLENERGLF